MSSIAKQRDQHAFGRAIYGFGLMVLSVLLLLLYLFFAFVPDSILQDWGFNCYPSKHWYIWIPSALVATILIFLLIIHPAMNFYLQAPLNSINLVRDKNTRYTEQISSPTMLQRRSRIPPVSDMKIQDVCKKFYYDESLIKTD